MQHLTNNIRAKAHSLDFDACTICKAESVDESNATAFDSWIQNNYHADMGYMAKHLDKRLDPTLLVEGAKSIIMLALNYYPHTFQDKENPQIAYYAYGKDYHDVVRDKLKELYEYCKALNSNIEGRYFCDTAPLLERYWAAKSGMGWIGKNSLLIIPKKGSYFFLGVLILNTELKYDNTLQMNMPNCGTCTKCIDACPTNAITLPHIVDSAKCISYQTIENKGDINPAIVQHMNNCFYGCDICQQVCPWNKFAHPHRTEEFTPSDDLLSLTAEKIEALTTESYQRIFKRSAIKRAKLEGLKRNINALKKSKR